MSKSIDGLNTITGSTITDNSLTASQAVVTNNNNQLTSMPYTSNATASTIVSRDSSANVSFNGGTFGAPINYTGTGVLQINGSIASLDSTTTVLAIQSSGASIGTNVSTSATANSICRRDATGLITQLRYNQAFVGSAGQNVNDSTDTPIVFDQTIYTTMGVLTVGNTTFTAPVSGLWMINYQVSFGASNVGDRITWLEINGSGLARWGQMAVPPCNALMSQNTGTLLTRLNANDTVVCHAYQTSGGVLVSGGIPADTGSINTISATYLNE